MNKIYFIEKSSKTEESHKEDLEFLAESNISIWKSILLLGALCLIIIALTAVNFDKDVIGFLIKM